MEEMLDFCDNKGIELYIEIKDGTPEQIARTVELTKNYQINISWAGTTLEQCKAVVAADKTARVSTMPYNIDQESVNDLLSLRTGYNEVFFFAFGNAILTEENVSLMQKNGIKFEMGTIDSEEEILNYYNGAYIYCSGIESNKVVASKISVDEILSSRQQ